jgi:glucuronoarabinoxylan endo-1,4-beta-xylanase
MTWLGCARIARGVLPALALAGGLAAAGCFDSGNRPERMPPPPPGPVAIDLAVTHQQIDGFGASSAWTANNISDELADRFFSTETGIGLSLLRIQIKPTGNTGELATARKAVARGVKVWAAPWSPPAEWKDNGSTINGGSLLDAHRQDWANRLATFAATMEAQGVPLVAISAQNEPNYAATWDTCIYTPAQLVTFVRDFLGPALAAQNLTVPIMAPETQGWDQFARYADPLMADTASHPMLGPLATHHYGGAPYDYAPARAAGKVLWETEISDELNPNFDPTIDSGLRVAKMIHDNLVHGNVSAWHYWWLLPASPGGNGALAQGTTLLSRAWVMGNWSRFVRPGYLRVDATPAQVQDNLYFTAFHDPAGGRVVVVAVNQRHNDMAQDFTIAGGAVTELVPWLTAADQNLVAQAAVSVVDGAFSYVLPARSVTTFVGTVSP